MRICSDTETFVLDASLLSSTTWAGSSATPTAFINSFRLVISDILQEIAGKVKRKVEHRENTCNSLQKKELQGNSAKEMLLTMARGKEKVLQFEATPDLKKRVLKVKDETGRSVPQIMRAFTELGLAAYEEEGDSLFLPARIKKRSAKSG